MKNRVAVPTTLLLVTAVCLSLHERAEACGFPELSSPAEFRKLLEDPQWNVDQTAQLYRTMGPQAIELLMEVRSEVVKETPALQPAIDQFIDKVAAQRHATQSQLFWHTDIAQAQQLAAAVGKPILSLRLLGRLDEEFSCANSRFFRTTLYPNEAVSKILREQFILHWQSVRPVPKVTVDFGDGRVLQRTVTGNSIHYVVGHDGQIIEALPGLYAAREFTEWLGRSLDLHHRVADLTDDQRKRDLLATYHRGRADDIERQWNRDLLAVAGVPPMKNTKAAVRLTVAQLMKQTDDEMWELIAAGRAGSTPTLDAASIRLIRSENPIAGHAMELSVSKMVAEDPVFRLVANLERTIQVDTVRNEFTLHRQLHEWMAADSVGPAATELASSVNDLNRRVYDQLFRSPIHDPWLGLLPADTYNALDNGGVTGGGLLSAALPWGRRPSRPNSIE